MHESSLSSRRQFLKVSAAGAAGVAVPGWAAASRAPSIITAQSERPQALQGLTFGDPGNGSVVVWSRSDRPARMLVEWSYDEDFKDVQRLIGPHALDAAFRDFDGFWEFVAGPLNAGTFGPNTLDGTFGPELAFVKAPPPGQSNLSPLSGFQFFGEVNVDAQTRNMTVDLRDINGLSVFSKTLTARFY